MMGKRFNCGIQTDNQGQHAQCCSHNDGTSSARIHAHNGITHFIEHITQAAGMHAKVKDSQIAKHANTHKHGDIELQWKIGRKDRTVADITITHPRHGFSTNDPSIQVGTWTRGARKAAETGKINKHKEAYNNLNDNPMAFIQMVMSTFEQT